ncbi:MAG: AMP-binding protein [Gammaproteobacteria bacterium]|nr:AMP-binding protein [Gammaproteobacteria bacterium]
MSERNDLRLSDAIETRAERRPDHDVLTFEHYSLDGGATPDEVRTYRALRDNAHRIAAHLKRKGLQKGDRFAIMMRNHPEFVEAMIAASLLGAVFVPIDPRTRGEKLAFLIGNSGSRGIIAADYALGAVLAVRARCPALAWVLALETREDGACAPADLHHADSLRNVLAGPVVTVEATHVELTDPLQIVYTSGTTGDPKGVVGSVQRAGGTGWVGQLFGYQPDERPYTGLSFTHTNAQTTALLPALFAGHRAIISRRFTKSRLWDVCRRYGATSFSMLGGMATAIFSEPPRANDADNPVRMIISGGTPAAIWEPFEKRFGVQILEIYGANDGCGMAIRRPGEGPIGSFGKPIPGFDMKILDEEGHECPPGVVGEICGRPQGGDGDPGVEYFGNAEASKNKIQHGWNRSGDMGHRDADGWFYFDCRKGGGIRRNGDFIDPSFVERVIAEDPQVDDVFVYGIPASSGAPGERDVVATVVPVDRTCFDPGILFARCRAGLEPNFVPSYLQLVDEIPKTASEKPQERFLVERLRTHPEDLHRECRKP